MTKLGWIIGGVIVLAIAVFASLTSFGGGGPLRSSPPSASRDVGGVATVPVVGVERAALRSNWGEARDGGARAHHGLDIMAGKDTPVVAAAPGTIEKLFESKLGGTTLYVRSPDRRRVYYYAHLSGYAPGVREGLAVRAGDLLGYVGDTGDAGPGNYHLHFGLTLTRPDERWYQGQDVDPYPMLAGREAAR